MSLFPMSQESLIENKFLLRCSYKFIQWVRLLGSIINRQCLVPSRRFLIEVEVLESVFKSFYFLCTRRLLIVFSVLLYNL